MAFPEKQCCLYGEDDHTLAWYFMVAISFHDCRRTAVTLNLSLGVHRTFYLTYPQIQPTLSVDSDQELSIPNEILLSCLTFSHFIELLRESDPLSRLFYEVETIKNNLERTRIEKGNRYFAAYTYRVIYG